MADGYAQYLSKKNAEKGGGKTFGAPPPTKQWECPCGRIQPEHRTVCDCGEAKPGKGNPPKR